MTPVSIFDMDVLDNGKLSIVYGVIAYEALKADILTKLEPHSVSIFPCCLQKCFECDAVKLLRSRSDNTNEIVIEGTNMGGAMV